MSKRRSTSAAHNSALKTPYPPLPYIFRTLRTWGFTRYHNWSSQSFEESATGSCFRCLPDICFSLLIFLYFFSFLSEICFSLLFLFSLFFPAVWWFFVCFPFFRELFFFADFLFVFTFSFWPFGQRHRQWLWTAKPIFSHCFKVAFSIYHPCIFFSGLLYFS